MEQVVLITGGSSGIGDSVARILAADGCRVYEMSRGESAPIDRVHIKGDVTSEQDVKRAVDDVIKKEGRIDILINNAGFGISGAAEFTEMEDARRQMDVNFLGMARMCRGILKPGLLPRAKSGAPGMRHTADGLPARLQKWSGTSGRAWTPRPQGAPSRRLRAGGE